MSSDKSSSADLVAEANYLRGQAIRQELESGERMPSVLDDVDRRLPEGVQRGRPAFPMDDGEIGPDDRREED